MRYHYRGGLVVPFAQKHIKQLILAVAAIFIATTAMMTAITNAAITLNGCTFDDSVPGTWTLQADCISTGQINVPVGTTVVDGGGFTISPNWTRLDSSNNTVLGIINADGVTVNNLNIDGTNGTNLHGIQAYVSQNVVLNEVSILNNDRTGLLVNGSTVTVNNLTTGGNGWHGVNVDQGSGVVTPAILTVNGVSHHTDLAHIYIDHYVAGVKDIVDLNNQYQFTDNPPGGPVDDRLYTLDTTPVTVTINKYVDNAQATAVSANNASFPMESTWEAENLNGGVETSGQYSLDTGNNYVAVTSEMSPGADYATNEVLGGSVVAADCESGAQYELVGYSTGTTLEEAEGAAVSETSPSFTDLFENQYVIVWNATCEEEETVTVTINKYVNGAQATVLSANNSTFPMQSTWETENLGSGSGPYTLSPSGFNSPNAYEAITDEMSLGSDYATNEVTGGPVVGTTCVAGGSPFRLVGYTTGSTLLEAQQATLSTTSPAFTDLQADAFVIVWNEKCNFVLGVQNKEQCKNDGWKIGLADGRKFKNQGDCVSFFATKEKNKPSGV